MKLNIFFRALPQLLRRRGRALARQSSALLACGLLATIPNALLSCSKKTIENPQSSQPLAVTSSSVQETNQVHEEVKTQSKSNKEKIDFDLTKMSATMIYSTIFDMLIMPEEYVDKNIKLKGWFETYTNPETAEIFYAVVVPDATACCQQGLEFVWLGDHSYPADFPDTGADITVTGRYKLMENEGITYNYLEATSIEF
jgi:hypothetical protein